MIGVPCACGKTLKVREDAVGKRVKCPSCGAVCPVPDVAAIGTTADDDGPRGAAAMSPEARLRRTQLKYGLTAGLAVASVSVFFALGGPKWVALLFGHEPVGDVQVLSVGVASGSPEWGVNVRIAGDLVKTKKGGDTWIEMSAADFVFLDAKGVQTAVGESLMGPAVKTYGGAASPSARVTAIAGRADPVPDRVEVQVVFTLTTGREPVWLKFRGGEPAPFPGRH